MQCVMTYQTAAELRRANLRTLVAERGGQRELADLVGVAPAQISQWATAARDAKTGTPRTISDESARRLEAQCGKPRGWMDHTHGHTQPAPPTHPPQISLADALPVVLGRLAAGLGDYRAGQVLQALQSATRPGAPLEDIERDLLQWLSEPPGSAAPPAKLQIAG